MATANWLKRVEGMLADEESFELLKPLDPEKDLVTIGDGILDQ